MPVHCLGSHLKNPQWHEYQPFPSLQERYGAGLCQRMYQAFLQSTHWAPPLTNDCLSHKAVVLCTLLIHQLILYACDE